MGGLLEGEGAAVEEPDFDADDLADADRALDALGRSPLRRLSAYLGADLGPDEMI